MAQWHVFDANCMVGRHMRLQAGGLHTPEDLLADMDYHGVEEALVLDSLSRENHPVDGNARILEITAEHPRLRPAWAALPPGSPDEQPDPEDFLDQMRENAVGAVFLFPRQYRFNLSEWCIDALMEPLADARVPVIVNYNETCREGFPADETDWREVVALCRRWPGAPVIVSEFRIRRANRVIYRALDACENLLIELSGYWLHRGIEYITEHWGPERLVFGSNWLFLGPACTLATLTMADLSDEDKLLIAGENIRRLLSWSVAPDQEVQDADEDVPDDATAEEGKEEDEGVELPVAMFMGDHPELVKEFVEEHMGIVLAEPAVSIDLPAPADEFAAFAQTGERPEDMVFWDCHGHMGGHACHYHLPHCDVPEIVEDMDRLGVRRVCVFSFTVVFSDECFGNDLVAEAVRRFPERFIGFTALNPHRGRDEMLRELERCAALGLRGVKLIPWYQGYPEDGPLIDVACQWAHERKQIILNHHWGPPAQMERLVSTYPNACFITGHATTAYAGVMKRCPNLHVCTCPVCGPRDCEDLVAAVGANRVLFGSDLQDLPIAWGLGPILFARIPPEEKRMILGGNLRRILDEYSLTA